MLTTIIDSLNTRLKTVVGLPTLQVENKRIRLGNGKVAWCRSTILPAKTNISSVGPGGFNRSNGIFQVDLFYPQDASYATTYNMADLILDKFVGGVIIADLQIVNSYIGVKRQVDVDNYYMTSISVEWQQYDHRGSTI